MASIRSLKLRVSPVFAKGFLLIIANKIKANPLYVKQNLSEFDYLTIQTQITTAMAWDYTETLTQLFNDVLAQKRSSHMGKIENADASGQHGSLMCGDAIVFYIKVKKHKNPLKDRIIKTRYQTFGCTSAIASSEALCRLIEHRKLTPVEALQITNQDIVNFLGGIPPEKLHCSIMGAEVLQSTIINWAKIREVDITPYLPKMKDDPNDLSPIICHCFNLKEQFIKTQITQLQLHNLEQIKSSIKAGSACGNCSQQLYQIWYDSFPHSLMEIPYPEDLEAQIELLLQAQIIPQLDTKFELIEIKKNLVYCQVAKNYQTIIEQQLKEQIHPQIKVIAL